MFQGSIPALVTPMCADGSVDLDAWDRLLDFHVREGTDAVVVGGTTGESPTLEREELTTLVRRASDRLAGRMPVIAGSGTNSTAHSPAFRMRRPSGPSDRKAGPKMRVKSVDCRAGSLSGLDHSKSQMPLAPCRRFVSSCAVFASSNG